MELKVEKTFKLEEAVCNHGFFMMAPNTWISGTKTLVRPLRLPDNNSIIVSITQHFPTFISVSVQDQDRLILLSEQQYILDQVKRMLRLCDEEEEAIKSFHRLHTDASKKGFGRLFRNPTLFEDVVKSMLLCGCRFKDSLEMAEKLCRVNPKRKRGRRAGKEWQWNFPNAEEVSGFDRNKLKKMLGYRGDNILDLAVDVTTGKINLDSYSRYMNGDDLYKELIKIKGIGDFVSCNILMCIGFYHRIPVDSETLRHMLQIHRRRCVDKNKNALIKDIYDKYAPFQTLSYWFEILEYYETKLGKLSLLEKGDYKKVSGSFIDRSNSVEI
ncbi:hypothetical protein SSX86_030129 [Deinandra increscens subsp. villosa]|uniref:DNA-3-methyladenine glycosylase n=1 Tax=Deinandra increscens subsp. villosa TaxID=3103831 RepID=A0AAP0CGA8_9ASTR